MKQATPIERDSYLLKTTEPLSSKDKAKLAHIGVDAEIAPPLRILNPQDIAIGSRSVRRHNDGE